MRLGSSQLTWIGPPLVLVLALVARPCAGQEPAPDKSHYTLLNPTPRELMREMSTDRPDTTESALTVDAGHFQLEMSFLDYAYDDHNDTGVRSESFAIAPFNFKIGLLNNVDLQLIVDPYTVSREREHSTGARRTLRGFGDLATRLKINLWGNDNFDDPWETAFALMPFLTFPTASGDFDSDHLEGGIIMPLLIQLPGDWSAGAMAEFDFVRNGADDGYRVDFVHTATFGHDIVGELAGYLEYAGFADLDGDEKYRGYFDAGLTYALSEDMVLDVGIRVGLTEASDDLGLFAGMSVRY